MLPDDLAQYGLRDLIDCGADILDGDHRRHRIDEPEIGDPESARRVLQRAATVRAQTAEMGALGLPQQILDGVLTDTARVRAAAWQEMFDSYLKARAEGENAPVRRRPGRGKPINSSRTAPTSWLPTLRI